LTMTNSRIARLLGTSPNHVTKLLSEIRPYIRIENPQSKYRRIYSVENDGVSSNLLNPNGLSNDDVVNPDGLSNNALLNQNGGLLNPNGLDTQSKPIDIYYKDKKRYINKTDFSFSEKPVQDEEPETFEQKKQRVLKDLGFARLSEGIIE